MKKVLFVISIVMLLLAMAIPAFAAPGSKVEVCHSTSSDNNAWVLVNINDNAWQAHFEHGDAHPGDDVPGMGGYVFDESCNPLLTGIPNPPAGCYDNPNQGAFDIYYSGVENTLWNMEARNSYDGSCNGDLLFALNLVNASTQEEANTACEDLVPAAAYGIGINLQSQGWLFPATTWFCTYDF